MIRRLWEFLYWQGSVLRWPPGDSLRETDSLFKGSQLDNGESWIDLETSGRYIQLCLRFELCILLNYLYGFNRLVMVDFAPILHNCINGNKAIIRWSHCQWNNPKAVEYGYMHHINTHNIDGLVQERRNSIANTLELCLSCTKPLIWLCGHNKTKETKSCAFYVWRNGTASPLIRAGVSISRDRNRRP